MSDQAAPDNFEDIIRRALAPVEPPEDLAGRVETTLWSLTELAVDELEGWELSSMRDPRNWARPAAAVMVGSMAGGALVLVRARQRQRKRESSGLRALEKGVRDLAGDLEKRLRS